MKKIKLISVVLCAAIISSSLFVGCAKNESKTLQNSKAESVDNSDYEPVKISVNLKRSGDGDVVEQTFTKAPTKAVTLGDEFTDILLDLGLKDNMAGRTEAGEDTGKLTFKDAKKDVPVLAEKDLSKEQLLAAKSDFVMGWDSNFTDKKFGKDFCKENDINIYIPKFTNDNGKIEDLYEDYKTLGKIFNVNDVADSKVNAMKETIKSVQDKISTLKDNEKKNVFIYDSGDKAPFTACQGMPGNLIKLAGGKSIFDNINKGWATVSWEEVIAKDPEVIIIMNYGKGDVTEKENFLYSNEALKNVKAIKEKKVYSVGLPDMEGSAGSALVVQDMAKLLYPELFK